MPAIRRVLTTLALLTVCSTFGRAASITMAPVNIASQTVTFNTSFTVPSFDATLGMLTGVQITADAAFILSTSVFNGSGDFDSNTPTTESYSNFYGYGGVDITGPAGLDFQVSNVKTVAYSNAALASGVQDSYSNLPADSGPQTATITTNLTAWELGQGPTVSLNYNADILSVSAATTSQDLYFGVTGTGSGVVSVTYVYTPQDLVGAPEPSTWLLLGSALLAGFYFRKRLAL